MEFYEVYKMLVSTELAYKEGTPHALVTGIDFGTQNQVASVEFDYQKVYDREDKYHDVVGFYHTHPSGMNRMSSIDVETMKQWVKCLGKDLMCVIQTDEAINGWMFVKGDNGVIVCKNIQVSTGNDVNYDIHFDETLGFWSPTDFLLNGEYHADELEEEEDVWTTVANDILDSLDEIKENQKCLFERVSTLTEVMQSVIQSITKEEEDE
ncbi:hypothetical protein LCGC14_1476600 [marine sediment metagenome]|uniref:JAB domain-containing protein n=1 Tax=marine sediment metagenome TaxID=412755 RepID=A0A0F9LRA3_9ZZZZ